MNGQITRTQPARWQILATSPVAVAQRRALGTTARLAIWPAGSLRAAVCAVDRELEQLDRAASRFRADSEISGVHARPGEPVAVSPALAEAVGIALAAARWSDGLVDPTVGAALVGLGYDRDFVDVRGRSCSGDGSAAVSQHDWRCVRFGGGRVQVPAGVVLDLGATAKGLGADRSALAALAAAGRGGVIVSLGGDVAVAGESPHDGWPVLVADDCQRRSQIVRIDSGGLATSSISVRQWQRSGRTVHHIVDPRTGQPADGPWRMVSVVGSTCADANAASTAAIVRGSTAADWLDAQGIPARLVSRDDRAVRVGGWPAVDHGRLARPCGWLQPAVAAAAGTAPTGAGPPGAA